MNLPIQPFDQTVSPVRFTTEEFARMVSAGLLDDDRLELIDGELHRMAPPMGTHFSRQSAVLAMLWRSVGNRAAVEAGIAIDDGNVLTCDVVVLAEPMTEHRFLKPAEVILAVEIAETSADRDLMLKRTRYATAGIPSYWVIDGRRSVIHVFAAPQGGDYGSVRTVPFGQPLPVPGTDASITLD